MRTFVLALTLVVGSASAAAAQTPAGTTAPPIDPAALMRSTTMLTPSVLTSFGGGATTDFGIGAQLRLDYYPTAAPFHFGGWVAGDVVGGNTARVSGGLISGMWIFDCEMGVSYRAATDRFAGSLGLVIGKELNFGWFTIGARVTIPLVDFQPSNAPAQRTQGLEGMVVMTVALPTSIDGPPRSPMHCHPCPCHHGQAAPATTTAPPPS